MWAAAAQPRLALTPMIPTPSFDRVAFTRACAGLDRGLGRDGLDGQLDAGGLADEEAAGLESHVPGEPEVLAVDLGRGAEADALVAHGGDAATVEVDLEGDGLGGAVHGQIADNLPGVVPQRLHARRREADRRVPLDIEEVGAREVRVTVAVSRAHAG